MKKFLIILIGVVVLIIIAFSVYATLVTQKMSTMEASRNLMAHNETNITQASTGRGSGIYASSAKLINGVANVAADEAGGRLATGETAQSMQLVPQTQQAQQTNLSSNMQNDINPKLIITADVQMECLDYDSTVNEIQKYTVQNNGYISNSSVEGESIRSDGIQRQRQARLTLRIPKGNHEAFLAGLKKFGQVTMQNIGTEDITTQYVDTQSRIKSFKIQEERLLELYKKADIIADIITIEDKLRDVRQQIESLTSQIKIWDSRVDYSTINITVVEVKRFSDVMTTKESLFSKIKTNVKSALWTLRAITEFTILMLAFLSPFIIMILILFLIFLFVKKVILKKLKSKASDKNALPENENIKAVEISGEASTTEKGEDS